MDLNFYLKNRKKTHREVKFEAKRYKRQATIVI